MDIYHYAIGFYPDDEKSNVQEAIDKGEYYVFNDYSEVDIDSIIARDIFEEAHTLNKGNDSAIFAFWKPNQSSSKKWYKAFFLFGFYNAYELEM